MNEDSERPLSLVLEVEATESERQAYTEMLAFLALRLGEPEVIVESDGTRVYQWSYLPGGHIGGQTIVEGKVKTESAPNDEH